MQSQLLRKNATRIAIVVLTLVALAPAAAKRIFKNDKAAADSFQKKVDFIKINAAKPQPSQTPTVFSREEINAYFSERRLKIPEGVQKVTFDLQSDQVTAFTRVDFERLRQSRPSLNPLLAIFDGVHDCQVVAHAENAGPGRVRVRVESVNIDGMNVPRMALQMFVNHYVKPKYPNVDLDAEYKLPARIDAATIKTQQGVIVQK
jgi:hypothetical protein